MDLDTRNNILSLGAGLGLRLANGRRPVWLDMGADYHHNGMASYLREGDIVDQADGSLTSPIQTGPRHLRGGAALFVISSLDAGWTAPNPYSGLATPVDPLGARAMPL